MFNCTFNRKISFKIAVYGHIIQLFLGEKTFSTHCTWMIMKFSTGQCLREPAGSVASESQGLMLINVYLEGSRMTPDYLLCSWNDTRTSRRTRKNIINMKIVKNLGNIKINGICVPADCSCRAVWATVTSGGNDNFATIVTIDCRFFSTEGFHYN